MDVRAVPFGSPLLEYEQQAENLLAEHRAADPAALDLFHHNHPRFLDEKIKWRPSSSPTPKSVTPPFASPGSGGPRRAVAVPLGPRVYLQSFNHHRTACATAKLAR
jgi:hypothetical protein